MIFIFIITNYVFLLTSYVASGEWLFLISFLNEPVSATYGFNSYIVLKTSFSVAYLKTITQAVK